MAHITPFRALRYNTQSPLDLALVTAPPYDCISPQQQDELYANHPHNIVRLILNKLTSSDSPEDNRYSRAAHLLEGWRSGGILMRDDEPAVYVLQQEFTFGGSRLSRQGFIARLRLEKPESRLVLPHEETFNGPRKDRLKLLEATGANLSAVMALFDDASGAVMEALRASLPEQPDMQTVDGEGVVNRLWMQRDAGAIAAAQKLMEPRQILIADGHHRYATSMAYVQRLRDAGHDVPPEHPAASILTMCIPMGDTSLIILPTHRVVECGQFNLDRFRSLSSRYFDWKQFHGSVATTPQLTRALAEQTAPAMGLYVRGTPDAFLLTLKAPSVMAEFAPEHSEAWRRLDVAVLHRIVLDSVLPEACIESGREVAGVPPEKFTISFVHRAEEAFDAVHENGSPLAFILRPPEVGVVAEIASAGELMPPKSTYFYPKILSGLVINPLD